MGKNEIRLNTKDGMVELIYEPKTEQDAIRYTVSVALDGLANTDFIKNYVEDKDVHGYALKKIYQETLKDYMNYVIDGLDEIEPQIRQDEKFITAKGKTFNYNKLDDVAKGVANAMNGLIHNVFNDEAEICKYVDGKKLDGLYKDLTLEIVEEFAECVCDNIEYMKLDAICTHMENIQQGKAERKVSYERT